MTLTAVYPFAQVQYRAIEPLARVLDTIEIHNLSRPTLNERQAGRPVDPKIFGLPDVYRINPAGERDAPGVLMTREFQFWIYNINVQRQFGRMTAPELADFYAKELYHYQRKDGGGVTIKSFNSLFRGRASHTNYAGVDERANFIANERIEEGLPVYSNVVTGRWVARLRDWESVELAIINAGKPFTHITPEEYPHLFDEPLNTGREFMPGTNIIARDDMRRPYGVFGNRAVMPAMTWGDWGVLPDGELLVPSDAPPLSKFQ